MYFKTVEQYEKESAAVGECLMHWAKDVARRVYQRRHGEIGSSKVFVCHTCDNRQCIRDSHHFLGTAKDNMQDAMRKGHKAHSQATKVKMSLAKIGVPFSPAHRANHKAAMQRPEIRAKYSHALKGKRFTKSHSHNHALAMGSAEVRAKLSVAQYARQADRRQFLFEELMGALTQK